MLRLSALVADKESSFQFLQNHGIVHDRDVDRKLQILATGAIIQTYRRSDKQQACRQANRQEDKLPDRQSQRQTDRKTEGQTHSKGINRLTYIQADRKKNWNTNRQADKQEYTQTG